MSKKRFWRLLIALICIIMFGGVQFLVDVSSNEEVRPQNVITVNYRGFNIQDSLVEYIDTIYFDNVELVKSNMDSDISIYMDTNLDKINKTGAKQVEIIGRSPIVAMFPYSIYRNGGSNFAVLEDSNGITYYQTNMYKIIKAFGESTGTITAESLGLKGEKGEIKLAIPDEIYTYRMEVVNAIIYCLTNGEYVTDENKEYVKDCLDNILSNAVNVIDIDSCIRDTDNTILIVPEYVVAKEHAELHPIYWDKCYASPIYCVRNTDECLDEYNKVITRVHNKKDMFYSSYIRNNYTGSDAKKPYNGYVADNVNMIDGQTGLEELLDEKYWI